MSSCRRRFLNPDLTIIDLPGIVRTTLEGQSKTVVADVDSLLQRYLDQKRTIILAVIPSNVDIATVDIIERASKADPAGDRTLGVLTKPDMIGEGAEQEKVDTLLNKNKPLKLGYIMVKNRSQKQIDDGISLDEAKKLERSWFGQHSHFRSLNPSLFGVDNLSKKLTGILVDLIKDALPQLSKEITHHTEKTSLELEKLGPHGPSSIQEMRSALTAHLHLVSNEIRDAIGGNYDSAFLQSNPKARIVARLRMLASEFNQSIIKNEPKWTVQDIKSRIREMRGRELPGFPKFSVFEHFVRGYVDRWKLASLSLLGDVKEMAAEACNHIIDHHIHGHCRLASGLRALLQDVLSSGAHEARTEALEALIANELAPMTENHYFMDIYNKAHMTSFERMLDRALKSVPAEPMPLGFGVSATAQQDIKQSASLVRFALIREYTAMHTVGTEPNETQEAEDLQAMLHAYWKASSKRFVDTTIQTVDRVLLKRLDAVMVDRFVKASQTEQQLAELFVEDEQISEMRSMLEAKLARLQKAKTVLRELGGTSDSTAPISCGASGAGGKASIVAPTISFIQPGSAPAFPFSKSPATLPFVPLPSFAGAPFGLTDSALAALRSGSQRRSARAHRAPSRRSVRAHSLGTVTSIEGTAGSSSLSLFGTSSAAAAAAADAAPAFSSVGCESSAASAVHEGWMARVGSAESVFSELVFAALQKA